MQQPESVHGDRLPDLDQILSILRWVAIAVVFLLAWANPDRPTHIAFLLATYNLIYWLLASSFPTSDKPWRPFAADLVMVSLVLALSGGLDSPAYIVYLLSIVGLARHLALAPTMAASLTVSVVYAALCLATTPGEWTLGRWETLLARDTVFLGVGLIASVLIQELRLQETASRQERERAAQWQELERMRSDLLSAVSHEFKTPLTVIRTAGNLLLAAPESLSPTQVRLLENIQRNEQRLSGLVNDLLDMARLESGQLTLQLEPLALVDVLKETVAAVRPLAELTELQVLLDVPEGLPAVWADRRRVGQVLSNLLGNAIQFSPPAGTVSIHAGAADPAGPGGAPGFVLVSVTDNGPGIPAHEQELVFGRFYRGSQRSPGGSGLGLSIARSLVELHGGRIWLESDVGRGSTFHFSLPCAASDSPGAD